MANQAPVGFFDSGVGGTSVWRETIALLPHESTIYLADSLNAPYGTRSVEEIIRLSVKNTEQLINMGCKLIVVPCNTATTNAINHLREHYPLPFVGIEPALKPAALASKNKAIGILATKGTLSSALFARTSSLYASDIKVIEVIGTGLVERIEAGKILDPETKALLSKYVAPMIEAQIDYLVLGCSHYPYILPLLKELLPPQVHIIDSGSAVARQVENLLKSHHLQANKNTQGSHQLYSNANTRILKVLTSTSIGIKKVAYLDF